MPTMITDACVNCGACLSICPNDGISRGEYKVELDAALCTECVGAASTEQCATVCPIDDVCIPDPDNVATEAALFERAKKIHLGSNLTLSPKTSHFRAKKTSKWWERLLPSARNSRQDAPEPEEA
jgi:Fe-S-cluster-containing dehydrogenase component